MSQATAALRSYFSRRPMPPLAMDADGEQKFITANGAHIPVGEKGELKGKAGKAIEAHAEKAKTVEAKRASVKDAMQKIAGGSKEETIPNLRDDLGQYGGTNDVTLMPGIPGPKGKVLLHIASEHGEGVIPGVLDAVIE